MRLIGKTKTEHQGIAFSHYLARQGIQNHIESTENRDWGSPDYGGVTCSIWIEDEEQLAEALKWYRLFQENPLDPLFSVSTLPPKPLPIAPSPSDKRESLITTWEKQPMGNLTRFFLVICCLLFMGSQLIPAPKDVPTDRMINTFFSSPIDKALLFDYPYFYELLNRYLHLYGWEGLEHPEIATKDGQKLYEIMSRTPYWQGLYHKVVESGFHSLTQWNSYPPLFEKIREGQCWRLFSPCLMHADIFHLFFNMLWLVVLGKQLEQRLNTFPYLMLILFLGVFSNTAQYLMSGPNFLGFSGILCGMLTFIWIRQRNAPWEGYTLDRMTFLFMAVFILGVASLQLISFVSEITYQSSFAPNIANTAHLSGSLGGIILGRFNFFAWRKGS